jgi:hypothetical protein
MGIFQLGMIVIFGVVVREENDVIKRCYIILMWLNDIKIKIKHNIELCLYKYFCYLNT